MEIAFKYVHGGGGVARIRLDWGTAATGTRGPCKGRGYMGVAWGFPAEAAWEEGVQLPSLGAGSRAASLPSTQAFPCLKSTCSHLWAGLGTPAWPCTGPSTWCAGSTLPGAAIAVGAGWSSWSWLLPSWVCPPAQF